MMFLLTSMDNLLTSIGISFTGSVVLLSFLILIGILILMFVTNIPSEFILMVSAILIISMNAIWGGPVLRTLSILIAIILGANVGMFILKFFNKSGD